MSQEITVSGIIAGQPPLPPKPEYRVTNISKVTIELLRRNRKRPFKKLKPGEWVDLVFTGQQVTMGRSLGNNGMLHIGRLDDE